jgi:hypothetical protein
VDPIDFIDDEDISEASEDFINSHERTYLRSERLIQQVNFKMLLFPNLKSYSNFFILKNERFYFNFFTK